MNIEKTLNGGKLTVKIVGRVDTITAPKIEEELNGALDGVQDLEFDFSETEYISSAGLRVMLSSHKKMTKQGGQMVIRNVNEAVMDIFEVTGFVDILNIE